MLTSEKGVSALQIYRLLGFGSYKTAWSMCRRVRVALANEDFEKFAGIVEGDETFIVGKAKNRHKGDRDGGVGPGGPTAGKRIVVGAVRRTGNVVGRVVENTKASTLTSFVNEAVSTKAFSAPIGGRAT